MKTVISLFPLSSEGRCEGHAHVAHGVHELDDLAFLESEVGGLGRPAFSEH